MSTIETQFGISAEADFENNTWTFKMPYNYKVVAGEFAIVDKNVYAEMIKNKLTEVLKECPHCQISPVMCKCCGETL